ncbi:hypothetical protein [Thiolapillus brandeum]|uniref:Uncharacterized protein n=1 Tax=Thiolapillus brandeum TaxID=1076588 RepID=A0A7U6GGG4_9GAMM|nr:hypothetical protein [Thiolapillus brandeum]BAO43181.1 hypothetical protein TBH_C0235 [Thiolapillus brandeum]
MIDYYAKQFRWFGKLITRYWKSIDDLEIGDDGKVTVANDEYQLSLNELANLHYGYDVNGEKLEPSLGTAHLNILDALTVALLRKLKELIDNNIRSNPGKYGVLSPISGYLKSINNPPEMLSTLLVTKDRKDRSIQQYMISRIRISGQTISNGLSENNKGLIQPLLGRYDYLHIYDTRPMCRCRLPKLGVKASEEDKWPPFFSRRELGIRYVINSCSINAHESMSAAPTIDNRSTFKELDNATTRFHVDSENVAVLAVTLNLRQERLDFLYRLLTTKNCGKDAVCVDDIRYLLGDSVQIYLTEGWCDILILFDKEGKELSDRLSEIFHCQNIIFQDFMVDNTELMLSPDLLEAANNSDEYKITIHVRIQEDRSLKGGNDEFIRTIKNNALAQEIGVHVTRTPGVTDYAIDIVSGKLTLENIQKLFKNVQIDVVQTTLGKVVPEFASNAQTLTDS